MPDDFGQVGPIPAGDGAKQRVRLGRAGEVVITDAHARFYEANYRGNVYHASSAVAGVQFTFATTIGTTGIAVLYNPLNSRINAVILKAYWQLISLGATPNIAKGSLVWAYNQQNTVPTGTALTVTSGQLGAQGNKCTAYIGANSFAATATLLRPSGLSLMGSTSGTSQSIVPATLDAVDGDIVVPPGFACGLVGIGTTGTNDTELAGLSWEEVPV